MKRIISNWNEWVEQIGQEFEELGDMGDPLRVGVEGEPLTANLILDVLSDLEKRGVRKENLVAVTSPAQFRAFLIRASDADPEEVENEEVELPDDVSLYGLPLRVEEGFPEQTLVLFPPDEVTFAGRAIYPSSVAVVRGLEPVETANEDSERVEEPDEEDANPGGEDEETERKGTKVVADGGYEPPSADAWTVALGLDSDSDLVVQAVTDDPDLDVTALEHRFSVAQVADRPPVAVYQGVMVHDHSDGGSCELYLTDGATVENDEAGTATLDDLPSEVVEAVEDGLGMDVEDPDALDDLDGNLVGEDAVDIPVSSPEDREPRGFR